MDLKEKHDKGEIIIKAVVRRVFLVSQNPIMYTYLVGVIM